MFDYYAKIAYGVAKVWPESRPLSMVMSFPDHIFKAYDIRGIYPTDLNEERAYATARWFAHMRGKELEKTTGITLVVARDMRLSSPMIADAVIRGFREQGVNVVDIGLTSTPTFYYAVADGGYDGGIIVSASHNPKEYSGMKIVRERGIPVSGDSGIQNLRDLVKSGKLPDAFGSEGALESKEGMTQAAAEAVFAYVSASAYPELTVVVDAANSTGGPDMDAIFSQLNCELVRLNWELDGTFPAHEADPFKPENCVPTQQKVKAIGADFGFALDGDGDRITMVTHEGELVSGVLLRTLLAQIMLRKYPGTAVIYDVRPGKITKDVIEQAGGAAVLTRVGHSFFKEKIIESDGVFGGENSGHFFFAFDYGVFDSITTVVLLVMEEMARTGKSLAELVAPFAKYAHSGEHNFVVKDVAESLATIVDHFKDRGEPDTLDGVSFDFGDVWCNIRGSNTEPKLRVNVEGESQEVVQQLFDELVQVITK